MERRVRQRPTCPYVLDTQQTRDGCVLHLRVPPDLYYLDGHFPQMPIVAGVCQLKWVIDYIRSCADRPLYITAIEDLKFQRPLLPNETFIMQLKYSTDASEWRFELFNDEQRFSSGRLRVKEL